MHEIMFQIREIIVMQKPTDRGKELLLRLRELDLQAADMYIPVMHQCSETDDNQFLTVATYTKPAIECRDADICTGCPAALSHEQKIFPSGRNGSIRGDALPQSRQRHPGGGLLRARCQFNASRSISPSDCCFTVSSRSVGLLF